MSFGSSNFPFVTRSALVPSSGRDVGRPASSSIRTLPPASVSMGRPAPIIGGRVGISRVEAVMRSFEQQGLSEAAIVLLMAGIRPSTEAAYQYLWDSWSLGVLDGTPIPCLHI